MINEISQIEKIPNEILASKNQIFALNYEIHRKLDKIGINHIIADNLLSSQERAELYDFITTKYKWFEKNSLSNKFHFHNINLFEIMDTGAIHENLLKTTIEGSIIQKIISKNESYTIICFDEIADFIKKNFQNIKIEKIDHSLKQPLMYERIDFRFNIGKKSFLLKISKNNYFKLKNSFEKLVYATFNLWYKKSSEKIILLTEFNPIAYKKLIFELVDNNYQVLFLNFRRPPVWNFESMKILKKSGSKIFNYQNLLNQNEIKSISNKFRNQLDIIFNEKDFFEEFRFNEITFWPLIKKKLKNAFFDRIPDYIKQILVIQKIIDDLNLKCFICLNEAGETEKILLKSNKQKIKSILFLHGFSNFHKETDEIRIRYDTMKLNQMLSDRFFVWGENDFEYYQKLGMEKSKLVISGGPRYDDFEKAQKISNNNKIVLITPEPLTEFSGNWTTDLAEKYESTIKEICEILKNFNDVEIIVKLHPGQNRHNQILKEIFNEIDSSIPIFQFKTSRDLINQCDLLLNITCESFDPSTVMLEGLILDKPVLEVCLDAEKYSFSNEAIETISPNDNLKLIIEKMLFNKEFLKENIKNRNSIMKNYLSNRGQVSKKIVDYINNW